MLIVYSSAGNQTRNGRQCFTWEGLPPFHQMTHWLGDGHVTGIAIEVTRTDLPVERINTYALSSFTTGSYDGVTLMVNAQCSTSMIQGSHKALEHLKREYKRLIRYFVRIVQGQEPGLVALIPPPTPSAD